MNLQILPLAITMMAGPQIMLSILLVTTKDPYKLSLAYISAIFTASTIGIIITKNLFSLIGTKIDFSSGGGNLGRNIQLILIGLLVILSIKTFKERKHPKTPKWLKSVHEMDTKKAFKTGLFLIFLMPTDIITMITVGINLETNKLNVLSALPFILLTTFIAALPLLIFLIFRKKAEIFMPKVRDWMTTNSWLVNIFVYLLFIYLIIG